MDNEVIIGIPVSPEAAEMLRDDPNRAKAVGRLISTIVRPPGTQADPFAAIIAEIKVEARADGLTDADIDAELAAHNAERRL
jgi:uncharacterized protein (DUF1786 family)